MCALEPFFVVAFFIQFNWEIIIAPVKATFFVWTPLINNLCCRYYDSASNWPDRRAALYSEAMQKKLLHQPVIGLDVIFHLSGLDVYIVENHIFTHLMATYEGGFVAWFQKWKIPHFCYKCDHICGKKYLWKMWMAINLLPANQSLCSFWCDLVRVEKKTKKNSQRDGQEVKPRVSVTFMMMLICSFRGRDRLRKQFRWIIKRSLCGHFNMLV